MICLKPIDFEPIYSCNNEYKKFLSIIVPFKVHDTYIYQKIENFGRIEQISINKWEDFKIVNFTILNNDYNSVVRGLNNYREDWSECKILENKNLTIEFSAKMIEIDDTFWADFEAFAIDQNVFYKKIGFNKIEIDAKYSNDESIRKILWYSNDDIIYLSEFTTNEIRFGYKQSFYIQQGYESLFDFMTKNKVYIQIFPYFNK